MSTVVVRNTLLDGGGLPRSGVRVTFRLIASLTEEAGGWTSGGEVLGEWVARTDKTGLWTIALTPNEEIVPVGTVYEVWEGAEGRDAVRSTFIVPVGGGPYDLSTLLADPPGTLPDSALAAHLAETAEEVVATLAVDGAVAAIPGIKHIPIRRGTVLTRVEATADTAPIGAAIRVQFQRESAPGTIIGTVWDTPPDLVADGAVAGELSSFDRAVFAEEDYLRVDVTQVGSDNPGANLVITILGNSTGVLDTWTVSPVGLAAHLADAAAAHAASAVSVQPVGNILAGNAQAALEEIANVSTNHVYPWGVSLNNEGTPEAPDWHIYFTHNAQFEGTVIPAGTVLNLYRAWWIEPHAATVTLTEDATVGGWGGPWYSVSYPDNDPDANWNWLYDFTYPVAEAVVHTGQFPFGRPRQDDEYYWGSKEGVSLVPSRSDHRHGALPIFIGGDGGELTRFHWYENFSVHYGVPWEDLGVCTVDGQFQYTIIHFPESYPFNTVRLRSGATAMAGCSHLWVAAFGYHRAVNPITGAAAEALYAQSVDQPGAEWPAFTDKDFTLEQTVYPNEDVTFVGVCIVADQHPSLMGRRTQFPTKGWVGHAFGSYTDTAPPYLEQQYEGDVNMHIRLGNLPLNDPPPGPLGGY